MLSQEKVSRARQALHAQCKKHKKFDPITIVLYHIAIFHTTATMSEFMPSPDLMGHLILFPAIYSNAAAAANKEEQIWINDLLHNKATMCAAKEKGTEAAWREMKLTALSTFLSSIYEQIKEAGVPANMQSLYYAAKSQAVDVCGKIFHLLQDNRQTRSTWAHGRGTHA